MVLEMRISTKRGKGVELLREGERQGEIERDRESENDGNKRYIILYEENIQQ